MPATDQLHPLVAHHVLNTLGWPSLRPLQKIALEPIASGRHVLVLAPTAGGKTEAAVFPVLTRMLNEEWKPLSVLYLCPLRALLNNLLPRIQHYGSLVGRRTELWHGDVGESGREAIRNEPPDILLTTPESIEAMLISRKTEHRSLFRNLRVVVIDEIHAFAGDDRGWHLMAVVERLQRLAGRELQRVGLSATIGNAQQLLDWMTRTCSGPREVLEAPADSVRPVDVTLDHVGSLSNAATVISRMHRGEKRLVFVDSRSRVEELAATLRQRDVSAFVSHGSLGREERHAAERAFSESRDCVIVATSTLELGIDVGDLDRVIQIDAPRTVASFLQRLGRTGRRPGTSSNALLLTTRDEAFLQALGLLKAWGTGFVEPLEPPPLPLHLAVQQILAIVLQEGQTGTRTVVDWLGAPFLLGDDVQAEFADLITSLLNQGILFEDGGILGVGEEGERKFGGRNFMDLMAVFSDPPMLKVLAGRTEVGHVPVQLLTVERPDGHVILLGGRSWAVLDVDWRRSVVRVEPATDRGRARWFGEGQALSWNMCQAMKHTLAGADLPAVQLSNRARAKLDEVRGEFSWIRDDDTVLREDSKGRKVWWTWAGGLANLWLASALGPLANELSPGDFGVRLTQEAEIQDVREVIESLDPPQIKLAAQVADGAVERLKFGDVLPDEQARRVIERRLRNDAAVEEIKRRKVRLVRDAT